MWYILLLEQLLESPKSTFNKDVVSFIKELLEQVKHEVLGGVEFELECILGFLSDVFFYVEDHTKKDMSLCQFASFCTGLVLLHCKSSEDDMLCCSDFLKLLNNKKIYDVLNLEDKLSSYMSKAFEDYKEGRRIYKSLGPAPAGDINQYVSHRTLLIYLIQTDMLKELELQSFARLDYHVKVDLNVFVATLNVLLNQLTNPYPVLQGLYAHLMLAKDCNKNILEQFDQLIDAVKRKMTPPENPLELASTLPSLQLELIPRSEQTTALASDELFDCIRLKLQNYIQPACKSYLSFWPACRNYQLWVGCVLYKIDKGSLTDIKSILDELYQINITHDGDELINIINWIDMQCSNELSSCMHTPPH